MNKLSVSSVEDLALELGGTVERVDGTVFNAAKRTGVQRLPTPRAEAPKVDPTVELLSKITEVLSRQQAPVAPTPAIQPSVTVNVPEHKRTAWTFAFNRNSDGTIASITATPKE